MFTGFRYGEAVQKLVLILLFGSIFVGALMPADPSRTHRSGTESSDTDPAVRSAPVERPRQAVRAKAHSAVQTQVEVVGGALTLERADDGHFYAEAQVNGMPITFLVDTGASAIALSRADAQRAFVTTDPALDEIIGSGASGPVKGQIVTLDRVSLGPAEVRDIKAAVLAGGTQSLLGQSFLAQFNAVTIKGNRMVLR